MKLDDILKFWMVSTNNYVSNQAKPSHMISDKVEPRPTTICHSEASFLSYGVCSGHCSVLVPENEYALNRNRLHSKRSNPIEPHDLNLSGLAQCLKSNHTRTANIIGSMFRTNLFYPFEMLQIHIADKSISGGYRDLEKSST